MGILYLVATPIGNLEDITLRALRVLREVSLIAAEDTRQTRKLLNHYGIEKPLVSYYEHNKLTRLRTILSHLENGDVALVSDAGTPGLNDPGYELVKAAIEQGVRVCPVPGPASPIVALVGSGLPTDAFLYLGYLPRKPRERQEKIASIRDEPFTLIFLETPHRLWDALKDLLDILGDRQAVVARELTKIHEEFIRGTLGELLQHFRQVEPLGEFVILISGATRKAQVWSKEQVIEVFEQESREDVPLRDLAERLAAVSGWKKNELYRLFLEHKKNQGKIR
ncbi:MULTISPECIES: 16S rRNA (cytidine(1402)-2'-O)-methyltransferase [Anaerolinea]|uniref:16S rRNA (cytidine(1402)-2'-O)-methyltransferase n=1 Tax=Anaerolinea TaxID=233189 RepID=UPI002638C2E1|nr:16S rRNA (cytidine(1402)-2'-O)-methyltransferase [Anaerolinea thermophila]